MENRKCFLFAMDMSILPVTANRILSSFGHHARWHLWSGQMTGFSINPAKPCSRRPSPINTNSPTVSAHLSGGSLVRGFRVQLSGVHLSGGSLVQGFTCPYFSSAITFWFGSATPRVRHFQGAPLDSISEHFAPRTVTHRYTTQQVSNAIQIRPH